MSYMSKEEILEAIDMGVLSWRSVAVAFLETCEPSEIYNVSYMNDFEYTECPECQGTGLYRPVGGCRSGVDDEDCLGCDSTGLLYCVGGE